MFNLQAAKYARKRMKAHDLKIRRYRTCHCQQVSIGERRRADFCFRFHQDTPAGDLRVPALNMHGRASCTVCALAT
jgi:hypothetical protein